MRVLGMVGEPKATTLRSSDVHELFDKLFKPSGGLIVEFEASGVPGFEAGSLLNALLCLLDERFYGLRRVQDWKMLFDELSGHCDLDLRHTDAPLFVDDLVQQTRIMFSAVTKIRLAFIEGLGRMSATIYSTLFRLPEFGLHDYSGMNSRLQMVGSEQILLQLGNCIDHLQLLIPNRSCSLTTEVITECQNWSKIKNEAIHDSKRYGVTEFLVRLLDLLPEVFYFPKLKLDTSDKFNKRNYSLLLARSFKIRTLVLNAVLKDQFMLLLFTKTFDATGMKDVVKRMIYHYRNPQDSTGDQSTEKRIKNIKDASNLVSHVPKGDPHMIINQWDSDLLMFETKSSENNNEWLLQASRWRLETDSAMAMWSKPPRDAWQSFLFLIETCAYIDLPKHTCLHPENFRRLPTSPIHNFFDFIHSEGKGYGSLVSITDNNFSSFVLDVEVKVCNYFT
jgi:hypothetical protein